MPPVVIAAGIGAAGVLGGAALSSRASNKASDIQGQTTDKTLAFAKEQEEYKRRSFEAAQAAQQRQYEAAQARRDALLASYGFSVPSGGSLPYVPAAYNPTSTGTIAGLMQRQGDIASEAARQSGNIWGSAAADMGKIAGQGYLDYANAPKGAPSTDFWTDPYGGSSSGHGEW